MRMIIMINSISSKGQVTTLCYVLLSVSNVQSQLIVALQIYLQMNISHVNLLHWRCFEDASVIMSVSNNIKSINDLLWLYTVAFMYILGLSLQ